MSIFFVVHRLNCVTCIVLMNVYLCFNIIILEYDYDHSYKMVILHPKGSAFAILNGSVQQCFDLTAANMALNSVTTSNFESL